MTVLEELDAIIERYFGTPDFGVGARFKEFGLPHFWASMIVEADVKETLSFGASQDMLRLEDLQRSIRQCLADIETLSQGTRSYVPRSQYPRPIKRMGDFPETPAFQAARSALEALDEWMIEMRSDRPFKKQSRMGRNWRAASVARACRGVWGYGQWHLLGRGEKMKNERPSQTADERRAAVEEMLEFARNCAPRSEKHDAPGPFGRFLEEVFDALGVVGKDGGRVSAHSALRALSMIQR